MSKSKPIDLLMAASRGLPAHRAHAVLNRFSPGSNWHGEWGKREAFEMYADRHGAPDKVLDALRADTKAYKAKRDAKRDALSNRRSALVPKLVRVVGGLNKAGPALVRTLHTELVRLTAEADELSRLALRRRKEAAQLHDDLRVLTQCMKDRGAITKVADEMVRSRRTFPDSEFIEELLKQLEHVDLSDGQW